MFKNCLKIIFVAILAAIIGLRISFLKWREKLLKELERNSQLIQTPKGPIEYISLGQGPTVLLAHGGGGGYDFAYLYSYLVEAGFNVVCPSRPGYLRTPLAVGQSSEEQADMFAALLEALDIEKAAIIGVSSGGQIALQFAMRHPTLTWGLVMLDAVSINLPQEEKAKNSAMGKIALSEQGRDVFTWLMYLISHKWPAEMLKFWMEQASTHNTAQIQDIVDYAKKNPKQLDQLIKFQDVMSPMNIRFPGLASDWQRQEERTFYPLEKITTPTLVAQSTFDKYVPLENAEYVADNVPHAELFIADSGGHLVSIGLGQDANRVQAKTVEFLKQHSPAW